MHIQSIPMCMCAFLLTVTCPVLTVVTGTGSHDNYAYLLVDDQSKDAVIIDPANPEE